jgi:hypothetical protein
MGVTSSPLSTVGARTHAGTHAFTLEKGRPLTCITGVTRPRPFPRLRRVSSWAFRVCRAFETCPGSGTMPLKVFDTGIVTPVVNMYIT